MKAVTNCKYSRDGDSSSFFIVGIDDSIRKEDTITIATTNPIAVYNEHLYDEFYSICEKVDGVYIFPVYKGLIKNLNLYKLSNGYYCSPLESHMLEPKGVYRKYICSKSKDVFSVSNILLEGLRFSFGIEFETCAGKVSGETLEKLGLDCIFDGSLRPAPGVSPLGGEYVTGILRGDNGIKRVYDICKVLANRCRVNEKCSVHVHIGNFYNIKEFVVYGYLLGTIMEDELFSVMPPSRRKNEYCRMLPTTDVERIKSKFDYKIFIREMYRYIFQAIGNKKPTKELNKKYDHPRGRKCGYDRSSLRYCWLNFTPTLFNTFHNEEYTLEFRLHEGTLSFEKVFQFIRLCSAFVNYIKAGQNRIIKGEKITIKDILKEAYPTTYRYSLDYWNKRKQNAEEADITKQCKNPESFNVVDFFKTMREYGKQRKI